MNSSSGNPIKLTCLRVRSKSPLDSGTERRFAETFAAAPQLGVHTVFLPDALPVSGRLADVVLRAGMTCEIAIDLQDIRFPEFFFQKGVRLSCTVCSTADCGEAERMASALRECGYSDSLYADIPFSETFEQLFGYAEKAGLVPRFLCTDSFVNADSLHGKVPFPGGRPCRDFTESCVIDTDGTVFVCAGCGLPLGNILHQDLKEILLNSHVRKFLARYGEKVKAPCRECPEFGACAGCRGRAWRWSGDFLAADPACERNREDRSRIHRLPVTDAAEFLPHRKPMLMVNTLLSMENNRNSTRNTISADNPFLGPDGVLHPAAMIELGAQSMGYMDTFLHGSGLNGALVEVVKFKHTGPDVRVGDTLEVYTEKLGEMEPWYVGKFEVCFPGDREHPIAGGELKVCQFE